VVSFFALQVFLPLMVLSLTPYAAAGFFFLQSNDDRLFGTFAYSLPPGIVSSYT